MEDDVLDTGLAADAELLPGGVTAPAGFRAGATQAGIKEGLPRLDLAVIVADEPCVAHGLFTQCQVVAAPVIVSRERLMDGRAQGMIINSGGANACTGDQGLSDAREMADLAAARFGLAPDLMLVASTGVIGVPLPMDRLRLAIPALKPDRSGGNAAARAIMTTDLVSKECALAIEIGGRQITIGGMAKGSGMIHPNMATMIAVVTTDAALSQDLAAGSLSRAADLSFNQVTVDGDTSTNDTLVLLASGASGGRVLDSGSRDAETFGQGLTAVCVELARMIARDGEGASRLVEVRASGARSDAEARRVARAVVGSSLVKAAIYGRDPNWGRIIAAVGNAGVPIDAQTIDIFVGDVQVAAGGAGVLFEGEVVSEAMGAAEVRIHVRLGQGTGEGLAWGCDLTEGYVKINAEYTT
jgi:glutamate N-acetyltransferase/amino-acid N-acetyltransferase